MLSCQTGAVKVMNGYHRMINKASGVRYPGQSFLDLLSWNERNFGQQRTAQPKVGYSPFLI